MEQAQRRPAGVLAGANPAAAEAFAELRRIVEPGPLDQQTVELVVIGSLAAVGQLGSLGVHVKRAPSLGVSMDEINQAIVVDPLRERPVQRGGGCARDRRGRSGLGLV
jgi:alkylhydroperoxidase/carboxymuconolactone decarboxylase family protein YurZ